MTAMAEADTLGHRRVLVVEDEYFLADDLARALQGLGADVVGPAPDLSTAFALIEGERVDAAVLDINLGGDLAYAVADALREQGVPFVFATGYDHAAVPAAYHDVPRWEKPFRPEDLARALPGLMPPA